MISGCGPRHLADHLRLPDLASAQDAAERISRLFENRYPKLVDVLRQAETDILAAPLALRAASPQQPATPRTLTQPRKCALNGAWVEP